MGVRASQYKGRGPFGTQVYGEKVARGYWGEIDAIDRNGHVHASDLPGLGVTFDWT